MQAAELAAVALAEVTGGTAAVLRARDDAARTVAALAGPAPAAALEGFPAVAARAARAEAPVRALPGEVAELRARGCDCAAAVAAPVSSRGELLALLVVATPADDRLSVHPGLVGTVADLLGAALAGTGGDGAERRLDPLTRLPNHRALHAELGALLRSAHVQDDAVALVLLDLDGLPPAGDEASRAERAAAMRELARAAADVTGTTAFRIGGQEFALLLRADAAEAARAGAAVAEELARATAGRVIASAGVAAFPVDAGTQEELVHQADLALHAAKRARGERAVAARSDLSGVTARSHAELHRAGLHALMADRSVRDAVADEVAALASAVRALGRRASEQEMLAEAAAQLRALLGATACIVSRVEGAGVRELALSGPAPWPVPAGAVYLLDDYPVTREAIEGGEPRFASLADPDVDPSEAYALREYGMQANLMLPLAVDGEPWGLVEIFDARPREFGPSDLALAELVVGQVEALLGRFRQADAVQRLYYETLASLSNALEAKDGYTGDHAQAVGDLAVAVARRVGLGGADLDAVEFGAVLHDIGKIRIPESILNKPGPLDDAEWQVMRRHPEDGERILEPIAALAPVRPIVRSSHERWDGAGYPDRLAGNEIPLGARIVSVCDAYRAMIEPRPYRDARDEAAARAVLVECAGTQFDPACVRALLDELDALGEPEDVRPNRPDHLRA